MRRVRWNTVAGAAIFAATLLFLGLTVARQWRELAAFQWSVDPVRLTLSVAALLVVFCWGVWVWQLLLRHLGVRVPFPALLRLWFLSGLARYVPGKIWQFVGAAQLGRGMGLDPVPLLTSMLIHTGLLIASAAAVAGPFMALTEADSGLAIVAMSAATLGLAAAAVHPRVLNAALRLVPRALHRDVLRWRGSWPHGLTLLGLFMVAWLGNGGAFALLVSALVEIPVQAVPGLVAANAIAVAAGILVFVVPAGLGAREAVLTLLLSPYAPGAGVAALLAVASRLWVLAAELIGALLSLALHKRV